MSVAATSQSRTGPGRVPGGVGFSGALASEWLKFTTLPSNWLSLAGTLVLVLGVAAVRLATSVLQEDLSDPGLLAGQWHEGVVWAGVFLAVTAALSVTGEYTSGAIKATLVSTPKRATVAVAKATVFAIVGVVAGSLSSGTVLFAGWIVNRQTGAGASTNGHLSGGLVAQLVAGSGLYLAGVSILAIGLAFIIRNPVGTLVTVATLFTVAPILLAAIPVEAVRDVLGFLPSTAGQLIFATQSEQAALSPWGGIGVLAIWAAVSWTAGAHALRRRDA